MVDLQQNIEQQTMVNGLIDNMNTYLGVSGSMLYDFIYMKKKIKDHFGETVCKDNYIWQGRQNNDLNRTMLQDFDKTMKRSANWVYPAVVRILSLLASLSK